MLILGFALECGFTIPHFFDCIGSKENTSWPCRTRYWTSSAPSREMRACGKSNITRRDTELCKLTRTAASFHFLRQRKQFTFRATARTLWSVVPARARVEIASLWQLLLADGFG